MYANGDGVPENDAEAVKWFSLAASQGDRDAQRALGNSYAKGEGIPENKVEAYKWFNIAGSRGDIEEKKDKETIASVMSHEQVAEAQRLSSEWRPLPK